MAWIAARRGRINARRIGISWALGRLTIGSSTILVWRYPVLGFSRLGGNYSGSVTLLRRGKDAAIGWGCEFFTAISSGAIDMEAVNRQQRSKSGFGTNR